MTDRELIELAAKAAGINIRWHEPPNGDPWCFVPTAKPPHNRRDTDALEGELWNPFEDDGDALRLAVKLRIVVQHAPRYVVAIFMDSKREIACHEDGGDPYAATRRAIVRAAAEIGKTAT